MNSPLSNLTARERRLAVLTLVLSSGAACVLVGMRAYSYLVSLNTEIAQIEQELLNLAQQNAQHGVIEVAYREVVASHSSEMTKEEIHDNLRREIFQLASTTITGKKTGTTRKVELVQIPTLREGLLKDEGEGYREYQIQFRIPSTSVRNLMKFFERVELSSQILRIDGLDLARPPGSTEVQAHLTITRTVLDNPESMPTRDGGAGKRVAGLEGRR